MRTKTGVARTVFAIASISALATVPQPARADFEIVVSSATVLQATAKAASASCTEFARVGGGFDTLDTEWLRTNASEPVAGGWRSVLYDDPASDGAQSFSNAAVCSDAVPEPATVAMNFEVGEFAVASAFAPCPSKTVAVNGGLWLSDGGGDGVTMLLAPAWPFDPGGSRLHDRADGESPGPTAWEAVARNDVPLGSIAATVYALCAATDDVVTWVESGSVAAGQIANKTVLCPPGQNAVGGGVDAADRTGLALVAISTRARRSSRRAGRPAGAG